MIYLNKYVPSCPRCGSNKTGYFLIYGGKTPDYVIADHMRKGELVIPTMMLQDANCFCSECGIRWYSPLQTSFKGSRFIREEKELRGITEEKILDSETTDIKVSKKRSALSGLYKKIAVGTGNAAKSFVRLFIYDATIGVIKDVFGIRKNGKNDDSEDQRR